MRLPSRAAAWREVLSLLKWSILAACTVGPGTVVVCAKAGADYDLQLMWTILVAASVAYVLQVNAARLTLESGMSLGAAIRVHFARQLPHGLHHDAVDAAIGRRSVNAVDPTLPRVQKVPWQGYFAATGVFVGNTAYEANCFVGALAALYVLYDNILWFRVLMAVVTGAAVLVALLSGSVDSLGQFLGAMVLAMAVVFAISAGYVHVEPGPFFRGLLPAFPSGSSVTVLALMATTCIPFNVFLAASMCGSATAPEMRRGVAFAAVVTVAISIIIIVIGSDIDVEEGKRFAVEDLGREIGESLGEEAKVLFCVGLYAAAYSSAITCPLGAALTAEQILNEGRHDSDLDPEDQHPAMVGLPTVVTGRWWLALWSKDGWFFRGSLTVAVIVAVVVSASNADTVSVILAAQVINGLLLPVLAIFLLKCVNDPVIMQDTPRLRENVLLLLCVGVTVFLASHLVLEQISTLLWGDPDKDTAGGEEPNQEAWRASMSLYAATGVAVLATGWIALHEFVFKPVKLAADAAVMSVIRAESRASRAECLVSPAESLASRGEAEGDANVGPSVQLPECIPEEDEEEVAREMQTLDPSSAAALQPRAAAANGSAGADVGNEGARHAVAETALGPLGASSRPLRGPSPHPDLLTCPPMSPPVPRVSRV